MLRRSRSVLLGVALLAACSLVSETPRPASLRNTIRWATASEIDNFGFDVYRGPEAKGPFERLTQEPIRGGGTTDVPRRYEFVDDTIEAGRRYYYFVESISIDGVREPFTPVSAAPVKGTQPD